MVVVWNIKGFAETGKIDFKRQYCVRFLQGVNLLIFFC